MASFLSRPARITYLLAASFWVSILRRGGSAMFFLERVVIGPRLDLEVGESPTHAGPDQPRNHFCALVGWVRRPILEEYF